MTWIKNTGEKPDSPDNQVVQVLLDCGTLWCSKLGCVHWGDDIVFYRTSPIIEDDQHFIPIIDNQRPKGLHDKDKIEVVYKNGCCLVMEVGSLIWGKEISYKLFYRLIKKDEEPKPKRVGELMTYDEWFQDNGRIFDIERSKIRYINYMEKRIKNDR